MRQFPEKAYKVPFFVESGFVRRKCLICGSFFWTQISDQEICGESPCQEYTFIGEPPTRKGYTYREMREAFLSFFEKNGHVRIKPYPVVARWRDDLYVTIASVVDFQPYVTDGIIPPPANPLVISQPCIRFEDIDNVGPTFGRHLTIFEMGGAHAFNYLDKQVYWKDQTVRYHHQFVTEELGIKSDLVVYKEGIWSGGGNAGPDLESIVKGLEIATLVFMMYKISDDQLTELPVKTVDTGYGIERYTWLSQGTPSGFQAVYGQVIDEIAKMAGLKLDEKLLIESAKLSGMMSLEKTSDRTALRQRVAKRIGMVPKELDKIMTPIESMFAIADHVKTLIFMLAEGVVPSNVREGYLTRLLFRRTYRLLKILGIEDRLHDFVDLQVSYWAVDYPHLKTMRDEILEALSIEEEKYQHTLERGTELIKRLSKELKAKGQTRLSTETLAELYDSHGLPPNAVQETAEKEGIKVSVPDNFYAVIAARHVAAPLTEEAPIVKKMRDKISDLPATRTLYYENAYLQTFRAKVLRLIEGKYVVLDQTAFYPEGGGQLPDYGYISFKKNKTRVTDVQKVGSIIIHAIEGPAPNIGENVMGKIDWDRRISLMRHHTATHILIGAARRVLGEHVWQSGAQKEVNRARLDLSHYKRITSSEAAEIEWLANNIVMSNLPVEITWMPREKAESLYGFRLYEGGVVPGREIRVVKIGEWDVEACGGNHCRTTGEIGLIKIAKTERIQDGVERLIFAAGIPAIKLVQEKEKILHKTAETLEIPIEEVEEATRAAVSGWKESRREIDRLKKELAKYEAERMIAHAKAIGKIKLVTQLMKNVDVDRMIKLAAELTRADSKLVVVFGNTNETARVVVMAGTEGVKAGIHAGKLASALAKILGGGGSGKPNFGQGGGEQVNKIDEALKAVKSLVKTMLTSTEH